jgi:hypothetical protein
MMKGQAVSPVYYLKDQLDDVLVVDFHPQEGLHVRVDVSGQE